MLWLWWCLLPYQEAWWSHIQVGFAPRMVPGAVWVKVNFRIPFQNRQKGGACRGPVRPLQTHWEGTPQELPPFLRVQVLDQQWESALWNTHKIQLTIKHSVNVSAVSDPSYISSFLKNRERKSSLREWDPGSQPCHFQAISGPWTCIL